MHNPTRSFNVRHLRTASYLLTGGGLVLVAASLAMDLDPTVLLIGMMLVVAGGIKIGMVVLWKTVAGFGAPAVPDDVPQLAKASQTTRRRTKQ